MDGSFFYKAEISFATFRGRRPAQCRILRSPTVRCEFLRAPTLGNARFDDAEITDGTFSGADLQCSSFIGAKLDSVWISQASPLKNCAVSQLPDSRQHDRRAVARRLRPAKPQVHSQTNADGMETARMKSTAIVSVIHRLRRTAWTAVQRHRSCQGNSIDSFERFCKSGLHRAGNTEGPNDASNQGSSFCFTPKERHRWRWYCRGFEEGSRCRSKSSRPLAVKVELREGRVLWTCYER